jgi:hypothetical protein
MMLRFAIGFAAALIVSLPASAQEREAPRKSLLGKAPPEIVGAEEHWFRGPATTLAGLKGNVVWLQFNF